METIEKPQSKILHQCQALLIGNSYSDESIYPSIDLRRVKNYLKLNFNYEIQTLEDPTKQQVEDSLNEMISNMNSYSILVVYYSGQMNSENHIKLGDEYFDIAKNLENQKYERQERFQRIQLIIDAFIEGETLYHNQNHEWFIEGEKFTSLLIMKSDSIKSKEEREEPKRQQGSYNTELFLRFCQLEPAQFPPKDHKKQNSNKIEYLTEILPCIGNILLQEKACAKFQSILQAIKVSNSQIRQDTFMDGKVEQAPPNLQRIVNPSIENQSCALLDSIQISDDYYESFSIKVYYDNNKSIYFAIHFGDYQIKIYRDHNLIHEYKLTQKIEDYEFLANANLLVYQITDIDQNNNNYRQDYIKQFDFDSKMYSYDINLIPYEAPSTYVQSLKSVDNHILVILTLKNIYLSKYSWKTKALMLPVVWVHLQGNNPQIQISENMLYVYQVQQPYYYKQKRSCSINVYSFEKGREEKIKYEKTITVAHDSQNYLYLSGRGDLIVQCPKEIDFISDLKIHDFTIKQSFLNLSDQYIDIKKNKSYGTYEILTCQSDSLYSLQFGSGLRKQLYRQYYAGVTFGNRCFLSRLDNSKLYAHVKCKLKGQFIVQFELDN